MSLQENEISWQVLRRIVHDWAGSAAELAEVKPLTGGHINSTLGLITSSGDRAVLKVSPHRVNRELVREAHQLELLRELGLPVPEVYGVHLATLEMPDSFLLMEHVEGITLAEAKVQCSTEAQDQLQRHLADLVLTIHSQQGPAYFRHTPTDSPKFETWPAFYRHVYDPIWVEVEKNPSLPAKVRRHIRKLHDKLEEILAHEDAPRLVHWDIWASNILAGPDESGQWRIKALLDPNCKYAHAEAEIAYMELFHTVTPAFMKQYQQHHRLGDEYHRIRKPVYQLYPMLHHLQRYGHEYLKPLLAAWERAASVV